MSISFGGIVLALIGANLISTTQIQRPLRRLQHIMTTLAADDLQVTIPFLTRRDEIGAMACSIATFQQALRDKRASEQQVSRKMAEGLERRARLESAAAAFENRIHQVIHELYRATEEMDRVARLMKDTARATAHHIVSVASGAGHVATGIESTGMITKALSEAAQGIDRQVRGAVGIATHALSELSQTDVTARSLMKAMNEIGSVIELIASIAAQTNLLALNATIEAARAGEAGRGFAVVAYEVKALATQTSRATDQISDQIRAIKAEADATVEAITKTGHTIREINSIATAVAAAAGEQQDATRQIAESVADAVCATQEMTEGIASVQDAATSNGAMAENVLEVSSHLAQTSQELGREIKEFLARVRAA